MSAPTLDIQKIAHLARLKLTDEEAARYEEQLSRILGYMSVLEHHDLSHVEPTAHAMPVYDIWREDESHSDFTSDQALSNAPRQSNGQFLMPRVVEE
jgi:aspartyl-tRNA(Asn)/glutamyl-tRNA(Gln) amidotransferase subunit C